MKSVGAPGRFAWILLVLAYINFSIVVFNDIFPSVYGATPPHHCRLPEGISTNGSIPRSATGQLSRCEVYVNYTVESGEVQYCPNGWVYLGEDGEATVPTDVSIYTYSHTKHNK